MTRHVILILCIAFIGLSLPTGAYSAEKNLSLDDYLYAKRLFDEGYFDLAAEQLERLLQNHPEFQNADEAHYLLADSYFRIEHYKKSRAAYLRLAIVFPESPLAAESLYKMAAVLEVMQKPAEAAYAYSRVHGFYPQSSFALQGLYHAIRLYETIGDTTKAESVSDLVLNKFPLSAVADRVRLRKARWLLARADVEKAKSLLNRLSTQTLVDSLAAEALLELGRIYRVELNWDKAKATWTETVRKDPQCRASFEAILEIADLYIYQGLTGQAIDILKSKADQYRYEAEKSLSTMKLGDAYYRQGNYDKAHSYYRQAASNNSYARLKSAWTAEHKGHNKLALQEYLKIAADTASRTSQVTIRIAMLAQMTGQIDMAKKYWLEAIADTTSADYLGNSYWELSKLLLSDNSKDLELLDSLFNQLKVRHPHSPHTDDLSYTTAKGYELYGQYEAAIKKYKEFINDYPASPFREPALNAVKFIRRTKLRNPQLVERMAELSSTPQGSVNPVKWARDWGDFYLDDFMDPIKAIDHYDQVIQDVLGSTDLRAYCLFRSGEAYLNLCQAAHREGDTVAVEMYCDSANFRLNSLEVLTPGSANAISLRNRIIYNDFILANDNHSRLAVAIDSAAQGINLIGIKNFHPRLFIKYFQTAHYLETIDSVDNVDWLDQAQSIETLINEDAELTEIRYLQLVILSEFQDRQAAIDSAEVILQHWQGTPATGKTVEWLIENPNVPSEQRLEYLHSYQQNYYYRVDPELHAWHTANAYDSLGLYFEAQTWRERLKRITRWGDLELDILNLPDAETHYRQGMAYYLSGDYERSAYEFRSYLNLEPMGEHASEVLLTFARISMYADNYNTTIAYLDTLEDTFPFSSQAVITEHLRPRLEMAAGNLTIAFDLFQSLNSHQSDPDSSFEYARLGIVCQYRMNKLDEARHMAKLFYKEFRDHDDLESVKAMFYLEKGRSLQTTGNFEEARKNFQVVSDRYSLSEWTDDTEFEQAMSFLKERNWDEGSERLTRFMENYPESEHIPQGILTLGITHLQEENYSEAIKYLKSAWKDSSSELFRLQAFNHLMTAYKNLRFWDAAIHLSREYLGKYPSAADAFNRKMDIGQFYIQIGDFEEAVRHYRPMLDYADAENEAEIQFYIGESYQKAGDYQTAILEYMKVRILGRETKLDWGITALYQSGNCYELLGDKEGATRIYLRIIKDTGATSNYGRTAQKRLDGLKQR